MKKFDSIQEFFDSVEEIKPVNLLSAETSIEDAIEHGSQVLTALTKARYLDLINNQHLVYLALKKVGCVPFEFADKKFLVGHSLEEMICTNSPSFPLAVYTQVFDSNPEVFSYALRKILGVSTKDSGWALQWLATQQIIENKKYQQKGE